MSYLFSVSLGARSVTKKRKRSSSSTGKKRRYTSKKLPRYPKISSLVRRPLKHKRGWPSRRNLLQMSWNSCSRKLTSQRSLSPRTFCSRLNPGNFFHQVFIIKVLNLTLFSCLELSYPRQCQHQKRSRWLRMIGKMLQILLKIDIWSNRKLTQTGMLTLPSASHFRGNQGYFRGWPSKWTWILNGVSSKLCHSFILIASVKGLNLKYWRYQKDLSAWNSKMEKMGYAEKISALQEKVSMLKKKSKEL